MGERGLAACHAGREILSEFRTAIGAAKLIEQRKHLHGVPWGSSSVTSIDRCCSGYSRMPRARILRIWDGKVNFGEQFALFP